MPRAPRPLVPPPPALPARYHAAWSAIVARLAADRRVLGATISGSVLRGEGGPTSDLDVYVLVRGRARWRVSGPLHGVYVEEFVNAPCWIERYLASGDAPGLHMLGHGTVVVDRSPVFRRLRRRARARFARGPDALSPEQRLWQRYLVWDAWLDAHDLLAAGGRTQLVCFLEQQIAALIVAHHALRRRWKPKAKRLLESVAAWDPTFARLLGAWYRADRRSPLALFRRYAALVRHVLAPQDPDIPMRWRTRPEALG